MIRKNQSTAFFLIVIASFHLVSCSKNIDNLPLNEKAVYQPNRYSEDTAKDRYRMPIEVLNFIDVKLGMEVVDLLAGTGYYSELFNYIVGNTGKVYLQNNSLFLRFSTDGLVKRLEGNRLSNTIRLDSEYSDMKLPKGVDIIFMGLSYHDFFVKRKEKLITAVPEEFYRQIKTALKPGGIVIVVDHSAKAGSGLDDTNRLHRIDEHWVKTDMVANGFEFIESIDLLRKPEDERSLDIWNKKVFHKTDRFIHKYKLVR